MTDTKIILSPEVYRWMLSLYEADQALVDSLPAFDEPLGVRLTTASGAYFLSVLREVLGEARVDEVCGQMMSGAEFREALCEAGVVVPVLY